MQHGALATTLIVVVAVICQQNSMTWFTFSSSCPINRPILVVGGESNACRWCEAKDKQGGVCTLNTGAGPCGQKYCAVDIFDVILPRKLPDLKRALKMVKHLIDVEIVDEEVRLVVLGRMLSARVTGTSLSLLLVWILLLAARAIICNRVSPSCKVNYPLDVTCTQAGLVQLLMLSSVTKIHKLAVLTQLTPFSARLSPCITKRDWFPGPACYPLGDQFGALAALGHEIGFGMMFFPVCCAIDTSMRMLSIRCHASVISAIMPVFVLALQLLLLLEHAYFLAVGFPLRARILTFALRESWGESLSRFLRAGGFLQIVFLLFCSFGLQERVLRPSLRGSRFAHLCSDGRPGRWMRYAVLMFSGFAATLVLDVTVSIRTYQRDLARNTLLRITLEQLEPNHWQYSFLGPKQAVAWEKAQRNGLANFSAHGHNRSVAQTRWQSSKSADPARWTRKHTNVVLIGLESVRCNAIHSCAKMHKASCARNSSCTQSRSPYLDRIAGVEGRAARWAFASTGNTMKSFMAFVCGIEGRPMLTFEELETADLDECLPARFRSGTRLPHNPENAANDSRTAGALGLSSSALFTPGRLKDGHWITAQHLKNMGFDHVIDYEDLIRINTTATDGTSHRETTPGAFEETAMIGPALRWMSEKSKAGSPFFATFWTASTHCPYTNLGANESSAGDRAHWRSRYESGIVLLDTFVGQLIDAMREQSLLDETLFVIAGDHGEEFGEHGSWIHGSTTWSEGIHVPLIVWGADTGTPGCAIEGIRSLTDVRPTVLHWLGQETAPLHGESTRLHGSTLFGDSHDAQIAHVMHGDPDLALIFNHSNSVLKARWTEHEEGLIRVYNLSESPIREERAEITHKFTPSEQSALLLRLMQLVERADSGS